jgi:hypothetical protein
VTIYIPFKPEGGTHISRYPTCFETVAEKNMRLWNLCFEHRRRRKNIELILDI